MANRFAVGRLRRKTDDDLLRMQFLKQGTCQNQRNRKQFKSRYNPLIFNTFFNPLSRTGLPFQTQIEPAVQNYEPRYGQKLIK